MTTVLWACVVAVALALALPDVTAPRTRVRALASAGRLAERPSTQRRGAARTSARHTGSMADGLRLIDGAVAVAAGVGVVVQLGFGVHVGWGVAAAAGIGLTAIPRVVRVVSSRRHRACRSQRLRAALRLVIAELEAGHSPTVALEAAQDLAPEVGAFADHDAHVVAVTWQLAVRHGLPLAGVLARVADDLDSRAGHAAEVAAVLAGPRASSALLALLPLVGVGLGSAMGARPLAFLFGSSAGQGVLVAGVLLDAFGATWTYRLTSRAELT